MIRKTIKILLCLAFVALFTATVTAEPASPANEDVTVVGGGHARVYNEAKGETEPANYIIQLKGDPVATYKGDVSGLAATSPLVTGARKLDSKSPESLAYEQYLANKQDVFVADMNNLLGRTVDIVFTYRHAYNGVAAFLSPAEAARVAEMDDVILLYREGFEEILTDAGPAFIGAETIWNAAGGNKGEGIIVGIIDTGINSGHPSFAAVGGDGYAHTNPFGSGNYVGYCVANPSFCNDKLIGAWAFHPSSTNPEDADGHGSHTASTVAGNYLADPIMYAPTISYTFASLSGVAPHANIIAYQVCVPSCPTTSTTAAVNQAVIDGVDVTNYSISGGTNPYVETTAVAFLNAVAAGVFPANSAGNAGPGAGTVGHQGPWIMTVAASTHNRAVLNSVVDLSNSTGTHPDILGESAAAGFGPATLVYAGDPPYNNPLCNPFPGGTFNGEIVVCDRGVIGRVQKGANVLAAGGGGMILANDAPSAASLNADTHVLPATHISYADGVALKAWMASGTNNMGRITGGTLDYDAMYGDNMASFSSRGPAGGAVPGLANLIKPDVTAPGLNILAAYRAGFSAPPEFNIISGTSMSSPHAAGAAALIRAMHPDWTPAQVKSALMMTGITTVDKEDNITPGDPFDFGAGRVNLTAAGDVAFVLDVDPADYVDANPGIGGDPKLLNLPSLANSACFSPCTWTRTISGTYPVTTTWMAVTTAPVGMSVSVTPATFELPPYGSLTLTIEADVSGMAEGAWAFADVRFVEQTPGPVVAPTSVALSGPTTTAVNTAVSFTADVLPLDTTLPLTYTWSATDQTGSTVVVSSLSDTITYTWATTGTKTVTVMAENEAGMVMDSHEIEVTESTEPPVAPTSVTINGPTTTAVDTAVSFTADVLPLDTTLPLTYTWSATDQTGSTVVVSSLSDTITYTWATTGTKTVTVMAENEADMVMDTHQIEVTAVVEPQSMLYLPILLKPASTQSSQSVNAPAGGGVGIAPDVHFPIAVIPVQAGCPPLGKIDIAAMSDTGSHDVTCTPDIDVINLTADVSGLVLAAEEVDFLNQDPTNGNPYDNLNDVAYITTTVSAGDILLVAEVVESTAPDVDLFVGTGDTPSQATQVCASTSPIELESCKIEDPAPGVWWILVQNWQASGSPPDMIRWVHAVLSPSDAGNMTVTGPDTNAGDPLTLTISWNDTMNVGEFWYGAFTLDADDGSLGGPYFVNLARVGTPDIELSTTSMSSSQQSGDVVTQTLTISNIGTANLDWTIDEADPNNWGDGQSSPQLLLPPTGANGSRGGAMDMQLPINYLSPADFSEGFDDIANMPGWFFQNNSEPLGTTSWFQGNDAVFPAHAGAPTSYIGANFNNTAGVGTISNWMLTPEVNLADGDTISFWTRTAAGSIWPDRLELRLSTNGASTNVGTSSTDVGDFTTLLLSVNPTLVQGGYPEVWTQFTATLSGIPGGATGRIAFRYFVTDAGPSGNNSNYIGIDTVEFTEGSGGGSGCDAPTNVPWVSANPASGTTAQGGSTDVTVTFDATGLSAGVYEGLLCVNSNDPVDPQLEVALSLTVSGGPPIIDVSPSSVSSTQAPDTTNTETLTIGNIGASDLNWTIDEAPPAAFGGNVLYDNGPLVTHPGAGPGGSDHSTLQNVSLGMTLLGANVGLPGGFRVTDDFTVAALGGWDVDTITFYGYQTGSTTTSSFTHVNYRIWDGPPNDPASNIVYGDTTTNRLLSTDWTNAYRVSESTINTLRPIMYIVASGGFHLGEGTYWIDWQLDGSIVSGPWQPPVTILGQTTTGNALQWTGTAWQNLSDGGTLTQQGAPFTIEGGLQACATPTDILWLSVNPTSGTTGDGDSTNVDVTFDSTGLSTGVYTGTLCISSNDPVTPLVEVPVELNVDSNAPVTEVFTNTTPVSILDNTVVTSTITVNSAYPYLWDLNMTTHISHTWNADIRMTIMSPAGTIVTISTGNGGSNDNVFAGTYWDDSANPGGQVPYTNNDGLVTDHLYVNNVVATPLVPEEAFGAFIGEDPNGVWVISIHDNATGDTGTLNNWSLEITTGPTPTVADSQTFNNNTPVSILDNTVVTSTITVTSMTGRLWDLNMTTHISHTWNADIRMTIMSPAGTIVTISTGNGGSNDNVFAGTYWDDSANPGGQVPYTNNDGLVTDHLYVNNVVATPLVPEEAFGAFIGEDPNGVWVISIHDNATGDTGTLNNWSLEITTIQ